MRRLIPVSGTLLEIKGWLYDWKLAKEKDNIPPYLMTLEDKRNEIYWHISSGRVSFVFEHRQAGLSIVEFSCEDDTEANDYVNSLLRQFSEKWQTYVPPIGFLSITSDESFAVLLENRWSEAERAISVKAYLSAVVLYGSILEGILLDMCERYPKLAGNAKRIQRDKKGNPVHFTDWKFETFIEVANELGWLSIEAREQSKSLKMYRNLVHPKEQLKINFYPRQETAEVSQIVLRLALGNIYDWLKNDNK